MDGHIHEPRPLDRCSDSCRAGRSSEKVPRHGVDDVPGDRVHAPLRSYSASPAASSPLKHELERGSVCEATYLAERRLKAYLISTTPHMLRHVDVEWATGQYTELCSGSRARRQDRSELSVAWRTRMVLFKLHRARHVAPVPLDGSSSRRSARPRGRAAGRRYYDELVTSVAEEKIDETSATAPPTVASLRHAAVSLCVSGALRHITSAEFEEESTWRKVEGRTRSWGIRRSRQPLLGRASWTETWVVPLRPDERPTRSPRPPRGRDRIRAPVHRGLDGFLADVRCVPRPAKAVSPYRAGEPPLPTSRSCARSRITPVAVTRSERHRDRRRRRRPKLWRDSSSHARHPPLRRRARR